MTLVAIVASVLWAPVALVAWQAQGYAFQPVQVATDRRAIVAVAILPPLAYILVLTAMVFTPVSSVAPAREVSILFATLLGAHFLREQDAGRRVAAAAITLGIVVLARG